MKRFTETRKWNDPWFRELSPDSKLAFDYICDNCDNAGVWEPDPRLANFCIKKDVDWDEVLQELGDRVQVLPSGKWWLTRFIRFQCGDLRPEKVPPHRAVAELLKRHGIDEKSPWITGEGERPAPARRETKVEKKEQPDLPGLKAKADEPVPFPAQLDCHEFAETWALWLAYRRERKLAVLKSISIKEQFKELAEWGLERAIAAIKYSMRQNWQGIFEEKQNARTNDNRSRSSRSFEHGSDYSGVKEKL